MAVEAIEEHSSFVYIFAVHLLAADCIVTTNVIIMPYKVVYLDSKLVTATMHGCIYDIIVVVLLYL